MWQYNEWDAFEINNFMIDSVWKNKKLKKNSLLHFHEIQEKNKILKAIVMNVLIPKLFLIESLTSDMSGNQHNLNDFSHFNKHIKRVDIHLIHTNILKQRGGKEQG